MVLDAVAPEFVATRVSPDTAKCPLGVGLPDETQDKPVFQSYGPCYMGDILILDN